MDDDGGEEGLGVLQPKRDREGEDDRREPLGVGEAEEGGADQERVGGELADFERKEIGLGDKAQQERAPEDFFHHRDQQHQAKEAKTEKGGAHSGVVDFGIRVEGGALAEEVRIRDVFLDPYPYRAERHADDDRRHDPFGIERDLFPHASEKHERREDDHDFGDVQRDVQVGQLALERREAQEEDHGDDVRQPGPVSGGGLGHARQFSRTGLLGACDVSGCEPVPSAEDYALVWVGYVLFDAIVAGVHLDEHGFADFVGAVWHGAVEREIVEEDDVSGLGFERRGVFDGVLIEELGSVLSGGVFDSAELLGSGIDAEASHFVGGFADVDDGCDHRVVLGWEIGPILVHREGRAFLCGFLEKLGMMQDDVVSEDFFCRC